MPRVPTSNGPQLRVQPLNPVRQQNVDVSSGLQAVARGIGDAAEGFDRIALREDQTRADQADAQITSAWLKWDAENRNKFRGQNADAYEPAVQEWWAKTATEFGKDLSPRARQLASSSLMRKQTTALGNAAQFVGAEKERYFDESADAKINSSIEFGASTGDVAGAAEQVRSTVAEIGARKGWDTDMTKAEMAKRLSTLHMTYIEKLLDGNAEAAQTYYNAAKDRGEILPSAQPRFERALKEGTDSQFAMKSAAEWAALPLSEQLQKAAEIEDPDRRKRTITEIKTNHALVKEAERQRQDTAADQAWQLVAQGQRVPPKILADMDGRARVQLQDHLRVRAEQAAARAERKTTVVRTDPLELAKVYDMMSKDPEAFKRLPLVSLSTNFNPNDIEQIARIQRDMLKPDGGRDALTLNNAVDGYTGTMSKSEAAMFKSAAFNAVDQFQVEKGRAPSAKERRQLLDDLVVEGVIDRGMWFDKTAPRFAMSPEEQARAQFPGKIDAQPAAPAAPQPAPARAATYSTIRQITGSDRALISQALRAEGIAPTEDNVQARYELFLTKKGQK